MTARNPLYYDSGNLVEMSSAQLLEWQRKAISMYAGNPSVTCSVAAGSGDLSPTMADTRFRSSAATQQASSHPGSGSLDTVTTNFDHISGNAVTNPSTLTDTGKSFPVYYDSSSGSVQAMSLDDFLDTFIKPAIVLMTASSEANTGDFGGTFAIKTSTSVTGFTLISSTAVFTDTIADAGSYSSGQIGTAGTFQDHNTTVNNYYLHRQDATSITPSQNLLYIDSNNDLREYATSGDDAADITDVLEQFIRDLAASDDNASDHNIRYNINGSGQTRGNSMVDTKLDGSGSETNRFVGGDDYRSQKFPNGSSSTISTFNFKINRE